MKWSPVGPWVAAAAIMCAGRGAADDMQAGGTASTAPLERSQSDRSVACWTVCRRGSKQNSVCRGPAFPNNPLRLSWGTAGAAAMVSMTARKDGWRNAHGSRSGGSTENIVGCKERK